MSEANTSEAAQVQQGVVTDVAPDGNQELPAAAWDAWYRNMPEDVKRKLSFDALKRIGDLTKATLIAAAVQLPRAHPTASADAQAVADDKATFWVIERRMDTMLDKNVLHYYALHDNNRPHKLPDNEFYWTQDIHKAKQFKTRAEAEQERGGATTLPVVEHAWLDPSPKEAQPPLAADDPAILERMLAGAICDTEYAVDVIRDLCPEGIEDQCDECGGDTEKCHAMRPDCPYPKARLLMLGVQSTTAVAADELARLRKDAAQMPETIGKIVRGICELDCGDDEADPNDPDTVILSVAQLRNILTYYLIDTAIAQQAGETK